MKEIIRRTLLSAATAVGAGTSVVSDVGPIDVSGDPVTNNVFYVTTASNSTTGTIRIEEAASSSFAGTWALIATVTCSTGNAVQVVRQVGEVGAVRARVTGTADGGGITVVYKAS